MLSSMLLHNFKAILSSATGSFVGVFMGRIFSVAATTALLFSTPALADGLAIEDIVTLSEMNLGDDAIIAKIRAENARFDLSTDQMIDLKRRGVSNAVIAAMVETGVVDTAAEMSMDSPDPMVPHPAGIYLLKGSGEAAKMLRIDPTSSSQTKTGGIFGYALTGGLAPMSMKVSIPGATSRAQASQKPYFYFFFDQAAQGAQAGSFLGSTYLGSSPAEFNLIKFNAKKDRREAKIGKISIGGAKMGIMDEDRIPIDYELVRAGVYKVKAASPLEPGEYAFLYSVAGGQGGAAGARIFDFSVR